MSLAIKTAFLPIFGWLNELDLNVYKTILGNITYCFKNYFQNKII